MFLKYVNKILLVISNVAVSKRACCTSFVFLWYSSTGIILGTTIFSCVEFSPYKIQVFVCFFFVSDPRVKGWLLLENYTPTFIFSALYLLIVWLGPKYMRNKQPFSCRGILVIYNLGLTLLSLYMFYEVREKGLLRLILWCLF